MMTTARELHHVWVRHGRRARELGFWAVANHRVGRRLAAVENPVIRKVGSHFYGACSLVLDLMGGLQVNRECDIGESFHVIHGWNVKIHPEAVIGKRVGVMHDVTIGTNNEEGAPVIGDDVFVGAGARILGRVHIGNGARIASNSLVIADVPAGATAVGVPARVFRYTGRPSTDAGVRSPDVPPHLTPMKSETASG